MAITKPTYATNVISTLGTTSQERGLTADEFKAKFDKTSQDNKVYTEDTLIPEIEQAKIVPVTVSKTLALTDRFTVQVCAHESAQIDITVPLNSEIAHPNGTQIGFIRDGAAEVEIKKPAGVMVKSPGNRYKLKEVGSTAAIVKISLDTWVLTGQLKL